VLAHTYIQLAALRLEGDLLARARSLASRAIEGVPTLSRAHSALAIATLLHDRNVASAERSFLKAIELDPEDVVAHGWYAKLLSFDERHDAAEREARKALETDPLSLALRRDLTETLFTARRYTDTIAEARELLRLSDDSPSILLGLSWIYYVVGDLPQSFDAAYRGFRRLGIARPVLDGVAAAFRRDGMDGVFRAWARVLREQAALGQKTLDLLVLSALLGDADRAFELIDQVLRQSHPAFLLLPACPLFDKIRQDHRYREALSQARGAIGR
jgi:tetratricopeptide (TPR) repeat protein